MALPSRVVLADTRAEAILCALLLLAFSAPVAFGACYSDFNSTSGVTVLRSERNEVRLSGTVARVYSVRASGALFAEEYAEIDFVR